MKIAIIGIGQSMRGDDAAGLEAVRKWQEGYTESAARPEVMVEASGIPGLQLLDLLTGVDAAILVDAVRSHGKTGQIHRLNPEQLCSFKQQANSMHGWGVAETLALAGELQLPDQPVRVRIVGIEAGSMEMGEGLSPEVQQAMPAICATIEAELQDLLA